MGIKGDTIKKILERYPNSASKTIARIAYKQNPELFNSIEGTRSLVRYYRGNCGEKDRSRDKRFHRKPRKPGQPFGDLPDPIERLDPHGAIQIEGNKLLVLSDIHAPYHNKAALQAALEYGVKESCDSVVLLGDCMDFFTISRYQKDPRERNLAEEIRISKELFRSIRIGFPDAKIYFKMGNHEERWEAYLFAKAPEVVGMEDFDLFNIMDFKELDITSATRMQHFSMNDINLVHGHEFGGSIWNPVNAARGLFLRAGANAMCGHFHSTSEHSQPDMNDRDTSTWGLGCLCDLHPRYRVYPKWNHGFAIIERSDVPAAGVKNLRIKNGKVI